jgi:hypothetical protein
MGPKEYVVLYRQVWRNVQLISACKYTWIDVEHICVMY